MAALVVELPVRGCLTRDNSMETHFVVTVTGTKLFPSTYRQET